MAELSNKWFETLFGYYSKIAFSERGSYRLARFVRQFRKQDQWQDRFKNPDGFELDLNIGIYPDICMAYGLYELDTIRLIKRILKQGDHFVDAGANIGYLSLYAAKCVGKDGHVDAFEPEPRNLKRLESHLKSNQLADRVTVHPCALSDHQGMVTLYCGSENDTDYNHGCTSLFTDHREPAMAISVECKTLDDQLDGKNPKLIKMDVEGAEPILVDGMVKTLSAKNPPILIGELNPSQARIAGFAPNEWICRVIDTQPKYQVYTIGSRIKRCNINTLGGLGQMNLLLKV